MDAKSLLLTTAFRHGINEPNIEAGFAQFPGVCGEHDFGYQAFCDAVADCLREGLIHEPVRLPEGALQCHWHLELEVRRRDLRGNPNGLVSVSRISSSRSTASAGNQLPASRWPTSVPCPNVPTSRPS